MRERLFSKVLVYLLIVTFGVQGSLVPRAFSVEFTAQEKVLPFLRDVVRLDMTKYNVKVLARALIYFVKVKKTTGKTE